MRQHIDKATVTTYRLRTDFRSHIGRQTFSRCVEGLILLVVLCSIHLFFSPSLQAETYVAGNISEDTTWSVTESPYIVTGDISVAYGNSLVIEAGVTVRFQGTSALQVGGTLIARGNEADKIIFTRDSADSYWGYILFMNSSTDAAYDGDGNYTGGSILEYCVVEYAGGSSVDYNGAVRLDSAHPFINHCLIRKNKASGIRARNLSGLLKIYNNTITGSLGRGINVNGETAIIFNNIISKNTAGEGEGGGIEANKFTGQITKNLIRDNIAYVGGGIYVSNGTFTISDNVIIENTASGYGAGYGGGIRVQTGKANISNNILSNNTAVAEGGGISLNSIAIINNNSIVNNNAKTISAANVIYASQFNYNTVTNNIPIGSTGSCALKVSGASLYTNVNSNNIFKNTVTYDTYEFVNRGSSDVNAINNWWDITSDVDLENKFYHGFDDSSLGLIVYSPWETSIRTDTPVAPPTGLVVKTTNTGISVSWSPNMESDVVGYRVYYDTDGYPYDNVIDVGPATTCTLPLLKGAVKYHVGVTAYDSSYNADVDIPETIVNESQTNGNESWYADATVDLPFVTIAATDNQASESGDPGLFTITRIGDTNMPLRIKYSMGGTATNGVDYRMLYGIVWLPSGSSSAVVKVIPYNDSKSEGKETVTLKLIKLPSYQLGAEHSATVTIWDNDVPTVTIRATDSEASESGDTAKFTVRRTGDTSLPLRVNYTLSGSATMGEDYADLPGFVNILAGHLQAVIRIKPIDDSTVEGNQTIAISLTHSPSYKIGLPDEASISIVDNDF